MLITQAEWARCRGFSRQYVTQLIKMGVVRLIDGKIDPDQADAALAAVREPARAERRAGREGRPPAAASPSSASSDLPTLLLKTRIKSEAERAKLLEIKAKSLPSRRRGSRPAGTSTPTRSGWRPSTRRGPCATTC